MSKIKVEFFHDIICSFCYPMSFRMRKVAELMPQVEIIHRSFALVKDEEDFVQMFGSRQAAKNEIVKHWAHANENDDLHRFNIKGMMEADFLFPMSMKPLWACKAAGLAGGEKTYWDLFDKLQESFFTENKNIEDDEVIFENVRALDIDFDEWYNLFLSDEIKRGVDEDIRLAAKYGIHSVPALIINGKYLVSGALSIEEIIKGIEKAENQETMDGELRN